MTTGAKVIMTRKTCHMSISLDGFVATPVEVTHSPFATHIRYRVGAG
jgi:hypothetical protein